MRINYIILAHKNPIQIKRLITRLSENWTYFYLHLDANINIRPFKESLSNFNNITFLNENERFPGIWGDIGIVKGTLAAMRKIAEGNEKGYTILLSGQDYPIKDNNAILKFLENKKSNYININPISELWGQHGIDRIKKYKINKSTKRGHFMLLSNVLDKDFYNIKTIGKLNYLRKEKKWKSALKIFKKRNFKKIPNHYGGSVYWALPNYTLRIIIDFINKNPGYVKFHEDTLCPDEIFFQSIIAYLSKTNYLEIDRSLTYVNWERSSGPKPVLFKEWDFNELREASKFFLFARKFDIDLDRKIFEKIDSTLLY